MDESREQHGESHKSLNTIIPCIQYYRKGKPIGQGLLRTRDRGLTAEKRHRTFGIMQVFSVLIIVEDARAYTVVYVCKYIFPKSLN